MVSNGDQVHLLVIRLIEGIFVN